MIFTILGKLEVVEYKKPDIFPPFTMSLGDGSTP